MASFIPGVCFRRCGEHLRVHDWFPGPGDITGLCPSLRVALTWLLLTPLLGKEVLFPFLFYDGESISLTFTNERQHDCTDLFWVHSPKLCQANFVDFIAIAHTVWYDREKQNKQTKKTTPGSLIFVPLKSKLFSLPVCLKDFLIL